MNKNGFKYSKRIIFVIKLAAIINMLLFSISINAADTNNMDVKVIISSLTDSTESRILTSLAGEQNAKVKVGITRIDGSSHTLDPVSVIVVLYDDKNLVVSSKLIPQFTLGTDTSRIVSADFDLSQYMGINDKWSFKAYIWKLSDIKPLAKPVVLPEKPFWWGINGHTGKVTAYPMSSLNEQMDLVKALGCNLYRVDCKVEGTYPNYTFDTATGRVVAAAQSRGLKVYMVFMAGLGLDNNLNPTSSRAEIKEAAKDAATYFNTYYPGVVQFYQIGNENDNKCIQGSSYTGESTNHYDSNKYATVLDRMNALREGFADAGITGKIDDPKLAVNLCYWHTGFLDKLKESNFQYNVIGYDWYTSSGYRADKLKYMADTFDKDIIIAEDNVLKGTLNGTQTAQANYIRSQALYTYYYGNSRIIGYIPYEMLDQYDLDDGGMDNPSEAHYGLVSTSSSGIGVWKKAAYEYRNVINGINETDTVFADYFDEQPANQIPLGWSTFPADIGYGSNNVKLAGNNQNSGNKDLGMRIIDSVSNSFTSAERIFSPQRGLVLAQWRFRENTNTAATSTNFILKSGTANAVELFTYSDGTNKKLKYKDGSGNDGDIVILVNGSDPSDGDRWYTVTVVADTDTDTFDIYVDKEDYSGTSDYIDTVRVNSTPLQFRNPTASIDKLYFGTTNATTTVYTWIDNVRVAKPWRINDNFDSEVQGAKPDGWTITATGSDNTTCTVGTYASKAMMRLEDSDTAGYVQASKQFTSQQYKLSAEWQFVQSVADTDLSFTLRDAHSSANAVELCAYMNGPEAKLAWVDSNGVKQDLCTIINDNRYTVYIKINSMANHTFDVIVKQGNTIVANQTSLGFRNSAVSEVNTFLTGTSALGTNNSSYIGYVKVIGGQE